jgi:tetratricopeptide (TPR) repeat protein
MPHTSRPHDRRRPASSALVVVVAVLIGLGIGRFATAGDGDAAPTTTTSVAAAADLDDRVAQLERAVASDPEDLGSLQALGTAYVQRASETGAPSFYELAGTALERAERLRPGDPDTALARGYLALALHEFDDALRFGKQALEQRPNSAAVLGVVVDAQVELGRYDDAAQTLQAMLDRDPGLPALARTSYQRELRGELDGALAAMQGASTAGSTTPYDMAVVSTLLGDLHLLGGDVDAAAGAYDDALRAAPDLVTAQLGAARVQAARGDVDGAIAALRDQTQTTPTPDALVLLAALQDRAGRADAAAGTVEVVRAVATLQQASGQVVDLEMALFEADHGDPARALELARAAHAARPDNVFADDALAWALFTTGDVAAARALVDEALRLGSVDPLVRWHAAEVLAATGETAQAAEHLRVVLRSAPWGTVVDPRRVVALGAQLDVDLPPAWHDVPAAA